jgi:hypothetical protein
MSWLGGGPRPGTSGSDTPPIAALRPDEPKPSAPAPSRYAVVLVRADDRLNLRAAPDPDAEIVARLAPDARDLTGTGAEREVRGARWLELEVEGRRGWAHAGFLTPSAPDATAAVAAIDRFVIERAAASTIAPRGLWLGRGGQLVRATAAEATTVVVPGPAPDPGDCAEALHSAGTVLEPLFAAWTSPAAERRAGPATRPELRGFRCVTSRSRDTEHFEICVEGSPAAVVAIERRTGPLPSERRSAPSLPLPPRSSSAAPTPAPGGAATPRRVVVEVARGDVLNARRAPSASAPIVHRFAFDARGLVPTGRRDEAAGQPWVEVDTPAGPGWVAERFLSEEVDAGQFASDRRVPALVAELADVLRRAGDLGPLVARRGLIVNTFGTAERIPPERLAAVLRDPARTLVNGPACERCVETTAGERIGGAVLDAWYDLQRRVAFDSRQSGGNASFGTPPELAGFHFVSLYDPGDVACLGLDWVEARILIEYEAGTPKVAGLVSDAWSP